MRRRLIAALALVAGLAAPSGAAAPGALDVGVTVHFGQGWPESAHATLAASGAVTVREALGWRAVEARRGVYTFGDKTSGQIDRLCRDGYRVVLVTLLNNPLYDGNNTVYSPVGRKALANYLGAVAGRYADCLAAIEIGNEINIRANLTGVAARTRAESYVGILKSVYPAIKAAAPAVAVLGGSANSIATGFEIELADAGMLDAVDGVVVHPYRQDASNVDWELARLQAALAARAPAGKPVPPIWITEFSKDFAAGEDAAAFYARMVTLMSAAGIERAQWYALLDQPRFPTMGLYTGPGARKPAGEAFAYFGRGVLPRGRAIRQGSDPTLFHFRFGSDRQIVWGAPRPLIVTGVATARNAQGRNMPMPETVGATPVIIEGAASLAFGPAAILADSLYGYGRAPWSYHARRGRQPEFALEPIDWNWSSFIGSPILRPAVINQLGLVAVGFNNGTDLITRWTAAAGGRVTALACLRRRTTTGDGGVLDILHNGRSLGTLTAAAPGDADMVQAALPVTVAAGDRIDFAIRPASDPKGDNFGYRFQIGREGVDPPSC
jgi:Glycosyl hydrolase catalytic core